jgi:hypothetical protein
MEFLRRWIIYYLNFALKVDCYNNVKDAINYESESFKPRDLKALLHLLSNLYPNSKQVSGREAAKEIVHNAVTILRRFDRRFRDRTNNSCGCRLGGKDFRPDFSNLFEDVCGFLQYCQMVNDCGIERFLKLHKPSEASKLLESDEVSKKTAAGKSLLKFKQNGIHITCKECQKIGDIVIALEQRPAWCLIHIDSAFDILCSVTNRDHVRIQSVKAIEGNI